jgi:hypothetical protein
VCIASYIFSHAGNEAHLTTANLTAAPRLKKKVGKQEAQHNATLLAPPPLFHSFILTIMRVAQKRDSVSFQRYALMGRSVQ